MWGADTTTHVLQYHTKTGNFFRNAEWGYAVLLLVYTCVLVWGMLVYDHALLSGWARYIYRPSKQEYKEATKALEEKLVKKFGCFCAHLLYMLFGALSMLPLLLLGPFIWMIYRPIKYSFLVMFLGLTYLMFCSGYIFLIGSGVLIFDPSIRRQIDDQPLEHCICYCEYPVVQRDYAYVLLGLAIIFVKCVLKFKQIGFGDNIHRLVSVTPSVPYDFLQDVQSSDPALDVPRTLLSQDGEGAHLLLHRRRDNHV